ncbi:MAG: hypothetical protein O3C63_06850, partial [Cyanobacteria bacterium]|nr:hypothetical protein [Cyanobacteriota bacterium]
MFGFKQLGFSYSQIVENSQALRFSLSSIEGQQSLFTVLKLKSQKIRYELENILNGNDDKDVIAKSKKFLQNSLREIYPNLPSGFNQRFFNGLTIQAFQDMSEQSIYFLLLDCYRAILFDRLSNNERIVNDTHFGERERVLKQLFECPLKKTTVIHSKNSTKQLRSNPRFISIFYSPFKKAKWLADHNDYDGYRVAGRELGLG